MSSFPASSLDWTDRFSKRIGGVRSSFIREILKVTENPAVISFAGGLPSPELFPVEAVAEAANRVLKENGRSALQYSTTEGLLPLREWIAARYLKRFNLVVSADEILITTGSQQGIDLIGKVFINSGDRLFIERPGYLGAIQSFSLYEPCFVGVESSETGPSITDFTEKLTAGPAKLFYTVPNFQNPSGSTCDLRTRELVGELSARHNVTVVEDDPYGEIRFCGKELPPIRRFNPDTIMLGSFSKIVAPGLRLGWVCAQREAIRRLVVAKQAADLHSDIFSQRMLLSYLQNNNIDNHISCIREIYSNRCSAMAKAFRAKMPSEARCNQPDGGMFLWAVLPEEISTRALFEKAIARQVAFVPGAAFYVDEGGRNTMRLNFTNTPEARIEVGMERLSLAIKDLTI